MVCVALRGGYAGCIFAGSRAIKTMSATFVVPELRTRATYHVPPVSSSGSIRLPSRFHLSLSLWSAMSPTKKSCVINMKYLPDCTTLSLSLDDLVQCDY